MNWGYRIVIAFVIFMGLIISAVVYTSSKQSDLVADDYYMQEVNYQEIIDARQNSKDIKDSIRIEQDAENIRIVFPAVVQPTLKGTVHFFHPQNESKDLVSDIILNNENTLVIGKVQLAKGNYTLKFKWEDGGKKFYVEKTFYVS
ncbi:MAG: FixH family protein [Flavobacteriales bacterium]|nr:FixH family protein [Flavobacteriales bacterium]